MREDYGVHMFDLGAQRLRELVHVVDRHRVVHVADAERVLDALDAFFGGRDGALLLVDLVVGVAAQAAGNSSELRVEPRRLLRGARDDQRCAGFVDEDRVDLVDDGVDVAALSHRLAVARHVVVEVVETELRVRAVGDVGLVRLDPGGAVVEVVAEDEADR